MIDEVEGEHYVVPYVGEPLFIDKMNRWWFWDEGYCNNGPYASEHEARIELGLYCFFCLDGGFKF